MKSIQTSVLSLYRHFMYDSLRRNSIFLMLNTAVLSGTGIIFWALSARLFSAEHVGLMSVIVTASTFIAELSFLGLDYALIRFLPKSKGDISDKVSTALTIVGATAIAASIFYIIGAPFFVAKLDFIGSSIGWVMGFVLLMLLSAWNILTNSVFIALRTTFYVFLASVLFGVLRIPLLLVFKNMGLSGLVAAYIFALLIGVIISFIFLYIKYRYILSFSIRIDDVREMMRYSTGLYASNLAANLPPLIVPLLLVRALSPSEAAYYYIPFLLMGFLNIIPIAASQSLFAEGAWNKENFVAQFSKARKVVLNVLIPLSLMLILAGKLLLGVFGTSYAQHGYMLLVLMTLATIPKAISYLLKTVLRLHDQVMVLFISTATYTILLIVLSYLTIMETHNIVAIGYTLILCEFASLGLLWTVVHRKKFLQAVPPEVANA